jgi:hypothetical protein
MADTQLSYLRMTFKNSDGKNYSIQMRYPKDNLTTEDIDTVMDLIVTKNIISTKGGDLTTVSDGGVLVRSFTDLVD